VQEHKYGFTLPHLFDVNIQPVNLNELGIIIRQLMRWEGSLERWYRNEIWPNQDDSQPACESEKSSAL
jgi:hypothetical protein